MYCFFDWTYLRHISDWTYLRTYNSENKTFQLDIVHDQYGGYILVETGSNEVEFGSSLLRSPLAFVKPIHDGASDLSNLLRKIWTKHDFWDLFGLLTPISTRTENIIFLAILVLDEYVIEEN